MKITVSSKKYLPFFLLFTLILTLVLGLCFFLGRWMFPSDSERAVASVRKNAPVVVIDPGHGGEDGGAVGDGGVLEKDLNLSLARTLSDLLTAQGVRVILTRSEDVLLYDPDSDHEGQKKVQDLATRKRIAESYEGAVFVSIHMNAFPDPKYGGLQVYYSENDARSEELAEGIRALTRTYLQPENKRAVKPSGGDIYLLDRLFCPAVLVECGFLSNPEDLSCLREPDYRKKLSLVLCASIMEYLEKEVPRS